jgi:predicted nucleic acid-binding protein
MRIVIDTGVLWYPETLMGLSEMTSDIVLPMVAYSERVRQLVNQGREKRELDIRLAAVGIELEVFDASEAVRYASKVTDESWERLARDSFIAGHIREDDIFWTTNPNDFLELGVPPHQVVAVP